MSRWESARGALSRAWSELVGPEATRTDHLLTAATTVAGAVAWLDRDVPRAAGRPRVPGPAWAAAHYGYLMAATGVVRRHPRRRRELGAALTLGGLVLDGVLGPSARAPWFVWTYYPKLLLGHAGASLWSDAQLSEGDAERAVRSGYHGRHRHGPGHHR